MPRLAALLLLPLGLLAQASTEPALLPRPVSYQAAAGSLTLSPATRVAFAKDVPAFHAAYLAEHLRAATGVAVGADDAPGGKGAISLRLEPSLAKGYRLRVGAGSALVEGKDVRHRQAFPWGSALRPWAAPRSSRRSHAPAPAATAAPGR